MARNSFLPAGLLYFGLIASLFSAPAEETLTEKPAIPQVARAWHVRNTKALIECANMFFGSEPQAQELLSPLQELLPLPWAPYVEDGKTQWAAGTIVSGDKSWNLLTFPIPPLDFLGLSDEAQQKLLDEILEHPVGKLFFPDGEAMFQVHNWRTPTVKEIMEFGVDWDRLNVPNSPDSMVILVGKDFPPHYFLRSGYREKLREINQQCYLGYYVDQTVPVPGDESTVEPEDATQTLVGHVWKENGLYFFITDHAKEGTPIANARQAKLECQLPYRAGGFIDVDSPLLLFHRFFAEDAGFTNFRLLGGSRVQPVETRENDSVFSMNLHLGMNYNQGKNDAEDYLILFQKGDYFFGCKPHAELPPEEGVPTADEMNAANIAFWKSLEPLIDEIAAKIGAGERSEPIDIGAKCEDDVLLFAIAWKPGENEPDIDWNRLKQVDMSHMLFPNPYRDDKKLAFHIDVQEAGQWGNIVFSTVKLKCDITRKTEDRENFFSNMLVLGQGTGILCGAVVSWPEVESMENAEKTALEAMRTMLEECLKKSQQQVLAGIPGPTYSILRWKTDESTIGFLSSCDRDGNMITARMDFFCSQEMAGMLAQFAQSMFGDTAKRFGLSL